jgi:hypothetical protein
MQACVFLMTHCSWWCIFFSDEFFLVHDFFFLVMNAQKIPCYGHEIHMNKGWRRGLNLTFNKEKDKIMWFKNKNTIIKNKNMKYARPIWKHIFIMLITYVNMNMKKMWQGYGVRTCLRLMLNRLKEMKVPASIYTPLWI